jgi:hypothetical protein
MLATSTKMIRSQWFWACWKGITNTFQNLCYSLECDLQFLDYPPTKGETIQKKKSRWSRNVTTLFYLNFRNYRLILFAILVVIVLPKKQAKKNVFMLHVSTCIANLHERIFTNLAEFMWNNSINTISGMIGLISEFLHLLERSRWVSANNGQNCPNWSTRFTDILFLMEDGVDFS